MPPPTTIHDLPTELLDSIASLLCGDHLPNDHTLDCPVHWSKPYPGIREKPLPFLCSRQRQATLRSLCLASRRLHTIALPHLYHHLVPAKDWWRLARTLAARPELGRYARSLRLDDRTREPDEDDPAEKRGVWEDEALRSAYEAKRQEYLNTCDEKRVGWLDWDYGLEVRQMAELLTRFEHFLRGKYDLYAAFLVSMLPNLEMLVAPVYHQVGFRFCKPRSLPRLREVYLFPYGSVLDLQRGVRRLMFAAHRETLEKVTLEYPTEHWFFRPSSPTREAQRDEEELLKKEGLWVEEECAAAATGDDNTDDEDCDDSEENSSDSEGSEDTEDSDEEEVDLEKEEEEEGESGEGDQQSMTQPASQEEDELQELLQELKLKKKRRRKKLQHEQKEEHDEKQGLQEQQKTEQEVEGNGEHEEGHEEQEGQVKEHEEDEEDEDDDDDDDDQTEEQDWDEQTERQQDVESLNKVDYNEIAWNPFYYGEGILGVILPNVTHLTILEHALSVEMLEEVLVPFANITHLYVRMVGDITQEAFDFPPLEVGFDNSRLDGLATFFESRKPMHAPRLRSLVLEVMETVHDWDEFWWSEQAAEKLNAVMKERGAKLEIWLPMRSKCWWSNSYDREYVEIPEFDFVRRIGVSEGKEEAG
jgi:hypothetical protein